MITQFIEIHEVPSRLSLVIVSPVENWKRNRDLFYFFDKKTKLRAKLLDISKIRGGRPSERKELRVRLPENNDNPVPPRLRFSIPKQMADLRNLSVRIECPECGGLDLRTGLGTAKIICGHRGRPLKPYWPSKNFSGKIEILGDHARFRVRDRLIAVNVIDTKKINLQIIEYCVLKSGDEKAFYVGTKRLYPVQSASVSEPLFRDATREELLATLPRRGMKYLIPAITAAMDKAMCPACCCRPPHFANMS